MNGQVIKKIQQSKKGRLAHEQFDKSYNGESYNGDSSIGHFYGGLW